MEEFKQTWLSSLYHVAKRYIPKSRVCSVYDLRLHEFDVVILYILIITVIIRYHVLPVYQLWEAKTLPARKSFHPTVNTAEDRWKP